jgi:hypothetical protein
MGAVSPERGKSGFGRVLGGIAKKGKSTSKTSQHRNQALKITHRQRRACATFDENTLY